MSKSIASKQSYIGSVERKLEIETMEADSLKIRLDKEMHEKMSLKVLLNNFKY